MINANKKSFLLVDDNDVDLFLTSKIIALENPEFNCMPFSDGMKAFRFLEERIAANNVKGIQFIILDLMMPFMNGFEFLEKYNIQLYKKIPHLKIFVSSSSVSEYDKRRCTAYPFVISFVPKPFDTNALNKLKSAIPA